MGEDSAIIWRHRFSTHKKGKAQTEICRMGREGRSEVRVSSASAG